MYELVLFLQQKREDILSSSIQTRSKAHDIIRRMLASLGDPYTRFLSPSEVIALSLWIWIWIFWYSVSNDHLLLRLVDREGEWGCQYAITSSKEEALRLSCKNTNYIIVIMHMLLGDFCCIYHPQLGPHINVMYY